MPYTQVQRSENGLIASFLVSSIADEEKIVDIGHELKAAVSRVSAGQQLLLDFQGVEYISSAMVGQLVSLRKVAARQGVDLALRHVSPVVRDVLEVMNLGKVFHIED